MASYPRTDTCYCCYIICRSAIAPRVGCRIRAFEGFQPCTQHRDVGLVGLSLGAGDTQPIIYAHCLTNARAMHYRWWANKIHTTL